MAGLADVALFIVGCSLFLLGVNVILDSVSSQYLSTLSFAYDNYRNDTDITASNVDQNFTLSRISVLYNPTIYIEYDGGNESDRVYVNGNYVGNFTLPSPDNITFDAAYLEYETEVYYDFLNDSNTNVTQANITFYQYDGCNIDEETCRSLDAVRSMSVGALFPGQFFPLVAGGLFVALMIGVLVRR